MSARHLGLYILLASLTVLFGASLVGYLITRAGARLWRPEGMPGLPWGLWISTALVIALSVVLELALHSARHNRLQALSRRLWVSVALAMGFLLAQTQNWVAMHYATAAAPAKTLFPYTFYLLTGLHAAHVLGGLIPLGLVLSRAERREYSSSRHEGVALCVKYWHFLTAVWIVLFTALSLGS